MELQEESANLAREIERREYYNKMAPFPIYDTDIINDLKKFLMITKKENYNNVPVTYCKTCLSLHIKDVTFPRSDSSEEESTQKPDALVGYCVPCGNTDLGEAHIEEWKEMYQDRYGKEYLSDGK